MDLSKMLQQQLTQQLGSGLLDQLSQQIGGADKRQTTAASSAILSTLMGALARNAATPDGANSLGSALDRDHDGSILDDLGGILGGRMQPSNSRAMNGAGILKHILGTQQNDTVKQVSEQSGLSMDKAGSLMVTLAPILMGMLGKTKRSQGIDAGTLGGMLTDFMGSQQQQNSPALGMAERMLDRDGDGSAVDDIAELGMKMLGGFFGRK